MHKRPANSRRRLAIATVLIALIAGELVGERRARADDVIPGDLHLGSPSLGVALTFGGLGAVGVASIIYTGACSIAGTRAWRPARWTSAAFGAAILVAGVYAAVAPDPGDSALFGVAVAAGGGLAISSAIFSGGRHRSQVVVSATRETATIGVRLSF